MKRQRAEEVQVTKKLKNVEPEQFEHCLPKKACNRPYTLVLDLDETLIHFDP